MVGVLRRLCRGAVGDEGGASAVEFAIVAPVLCTLLFGTIQFSLTLNNYMEVTDGVRAASRVLSASRTESTPFTDTTNAVYNSGVGLTQTSFTITMAVNGVACASDTACATALSSATGDPETGTATYPCNLTVLGINYAPGCTLSSTTTERIE